MPTVNDEFLLHLLQACAVLAPQPLYPARFAREARLDRAMLDDGLDELRRRGFIRLTEWVKDLGQGCTLTEAGQQVLLHPKRLGDSPTPAAPTRRGAEDSDDRAADTLPKPYAARALLAINILFFAYGAYFAARNDLSVTDYLLGNRRVCAVVLGELGALFPPLVLPEGGPQAWRPQFERIVLFFFLHFGLFHLFMNMYFLSTIAPQIEAMWGWFRFLVIYFIAGLVSGCVILWIYHVDHRDTLTVGASGPLYGLFVAEVVWFSFHRHRLPESLTHAWSRSVGTNLIILLAINFLPGISWQGHLGGAIGGLLAALLLHLQRSHPNRAVRVLALVGLPLVPIAFFLLALWQAGWI